MNVTDLGIYENDLKIYQYEAASKAVNYLLSDSKDHALIHLPTGTGKTGVMATICAITDSNILIIVPNASLPKQVEDEIKYGFWESIKFKYKPNLDVTILNSKNKVENIKFNTSNIFIATIQFLQEHAYKLGILDSTFVNFMNDTFKYVLFDEGHKEPADKWSKVIRSLTSKIILFTATPYRNDNSTFKIDNEYIYTKKMSYFITNKDIKSVKFYPLSCCENKRINLKSTANITNDKLLDLVKKNLKSGKILIRCDGVNKIEEITNFLNSNDIKTLGFHSKLNAGKHFQKNGKSIIKKSEEYNVFIHCEMLIEGINVPSINTLIFLDTFSNFRSSIQQIGRTLRINNKTTMAKVYVPEDVIEEFKLQWEFLIEYEEQIDENIKYTYTDGLIKRRYFKDVTNDIFINNILLPKKATIYYTIQTKLWGDISKDVIKQFENDNHCEILYKKNDSNRKLLVIYYEEKTYSNLLNNIAYENKKLSVCVLTEINSIINNGSYYFCYNSNNNKIFDNETSNFFTHEGLKNFENLIDTNLKITKAKYEKTSPMTKGIRGREITGNQLENTNPSLEQKLSFCRNVSGKNDKNGMRYINTITSRVSDSDVGSLIDYIDWCKTLVTKIENITESNSIFKRFATITDAPKNPPTYLFAEFDKTYKITESDKIVDCVSEKIESLILKLTFNEETYSYILEKHIVSGKFSFKQQSLVKSQDFELIDEGNKCNYLCDILNKSNFRLYFFEDQVIFTGGKYYKMNITTTFSNSNDWSMMNDIEYVKELDLVSNEKYGDIEELTFETWPETSVFGVLEKK